MAKAAGERQPAPLEIPSSGHEPEVHLHSATLAQETSCQVLIVFCRRLSRVVGDEGSFVSVADPGEGISTLAGKVRRGARGRRGWLECRLGRRRRGLQIRHRCLGMSWARFGDRPKNQALVGRFGLLGRRRVSGNHLWDVIRTTKIDSGSSWLGLSPGTSGLPTPDLTSSRSDLDSGCGEQLDDPSRGPQGRDAGVHQVNEESPLYRP
jgi:hypothetical protein